MADYYSILEKTISGLPNNTPEVRNAVFKKARTAIETQLRNMDPLPSEEAIGSQLKLLEEAIVLIESEYGAQLDEVPADELPVVEVVTPEPEPPVEDPEPSEDPVPPVPQTPIASPPVTESVVGRVETAIDKIQSEVPPSVGLDISNTPEADSGSGSVTIDSMTADTLDPIVSSQENSPASAELDLDEGKPGGFLGKLIKILIVLGLLGGAGYAVWKNKDELTEFANNLMKPADGVEETTKTTVNETEVETPIPEPVEPEVVKPEVAEPEIVEPEIAEPEPAEPTPVEPEVVESETGNEVAQETVPEEATPATQQNGVIPIGEVAYLYEEGSAGSGATRTNAAITWETRQESLKEGIPPEPVIIGKMDIPEKAMSVDITLKRNIDEAVSASHMIEIRFNTPADFSGKSVESIARFVMKATEEAPGEPLVAVPVKVSEGNFLIALDNLKQAVAVNTQLLKESAWIDVPVVYGTGKRALITLEKGGTGARVFDEAFKDWQNR